MDKRRYLRYEILDFARVTADRPEDGFSTVIVDIGLGGLQLRTKSLLPIGTCVQIEVAREDQNPISLIGEVRHTAEIGGSDLFAMGVRFAPRTHEERMAIADYVHRVFQRQCDLLTL